jgi:hypothetical protein
MTDQPDKKDDNNAIAIANLCHLVGACLHNFSRIEESLAALYGTAAQMPSMEAAFRAHDEIREFQYRIGATDAVVRYWIEKFVTKDSEHKLFVAEWNTLHRHIKEDSQVRNKLAHFRIAAEHHKDGTKKWYVCPYFQIYSHISRFKGDGEELRIPEGVTKFSDDALIAKMERFERTRKRIDRFIAGLRGQGAQLPG